MYVQYRTGMLKPDCRRPTAIRNPHVISQSRDDLSISLPSYRDSVLVHVDNNDWDISSTSSTSIRRPSTTTSTRPTRPVDLECTQCNQLKSKLKHYKTTVCCCYVLFTRCSHYTVTMVWLFVILNAVCTR